MQEHHKVTVSALQQAVAYMLLPCFVLCKYAQCNYCRLHLQNKVSLNVMGLHPMHY